MSERDHRHPIEALSAFFDGELADPERREVEEHVTGCETCRDLLADLERVASAVAELDVPPVPSHLAGRIAERLAPEARPATVVPLRRSWTRMRMPLTAAATIAAVGLVAVVGYMQRGGVAPDRQVAPPAAATAPRHEPVLEKKTDAEQRTLEARPAAPGPATSDRERALELAKRQVVPQAPPPPAAESDEAKPAAEAMGEHTVRFAPTPPPPRTDAASHGAAERNETADKVEGFRRAKSIGELAAPAPARNAPAEAESRFAAGAAAPSFECEPAWPIRLDAREWRSGSVVHGAEELRPLVEPFDARLVPSSTSPGVITIDVPRARWPEVRMRLREAGVPGIDEIVEPPSDAACVRLEIVSLPR